MAIIMLLARQIPTEMSEMLKEREEHRGECHFCSVTTLTLLREQAPKAANTDKM